jgi:hypothetical protein
MMSNLPAECRLVLEAPDANVAPTMAAPGVTPAAHDPDDRAAIPDSGNQ